MGSENFILFFFLCTSLWQWMVATATATKAQQVATKKMTSGKKLNKIDNCVEASLVFKAYTCDWLYS